MTKPTTPSKELNAFCDALEQRYEELKRLLEAQSKENSRAWRELDGRMAHLEAIAKTLPSQAEVLALNAELQMRRQRDTAFAAHLTTLTTHLQRMLRDSRAASPNPSTNPARSRPQSPNTSPDSNNETPRN